MALNEWTTNQKLRDFVEDYVQLMKPERIHLCDGTPEESEFLTKQMIRTGTLVPLNPKKRPGSYLARSDPGDVARVEKQTVICAPSKDDVGPTNNWADPVKTREKMRTLYDGCMAGRTMYVVPYSMGPVGSELSFNGIEITDFPYVVQSMKVMSRMGTPAKKDLEKRGDFVPGGGFVDFFLYRLTCCDCSTFGWCSIKTWSGRCPMACEFQQTHHSLSSNE